MKTREILANLLLMAGTLFLCGVMAEVGLRILGYEYSPLDIQVARNDSRVQHVFEDHYFIYDPDLIWRPKRNYDVFNEQGFRGPVLESPKPAGRYRIFTVGDSNTLGWAGDEGANWPEVLDDLLAEGDGEAEVVNAGVWGYTSYQGVLRFRETLPFEPDLVLISFGSNDAHPVYFEDKDFGYQRIWDARLDHLLVRLRLGQAALSLMNRSSATSEGELGHRVSLPDYRRNLEIIIDEARAAGIKVILMTRPYVGQTVDSRRWSFYASDYNATTGEVAEEYGVPLIDLYSLFRTREDLFEDPSHFTEEGHDLAARIVYEQVLATIRD